MWFGTRHMLKAPEGLAAAFALRRVGHDVVVLERNETLVKVRRRGAAVKHEQLLKTQFGIGEWFNSASSVRSSSCGV